MPELLVILVIVLIFFGTGKLSEVGSSLGRGIREFRKASEGEYDEPEHTKDGDEADATA